MGKKKTRKFMSLFTKSVIALLLMGILPLLLMGFAIYHAYSDSIQKSLIENLNQMTLYVGKNVADILEVMEENTKEIYKYGIMDYDYFYELMNDPDLSETKRSAIVTDELREILHLNQYLDHVMFITQDGRQYTCMRPPEIMVNKNAMLSFHERNYKKGEREAIVIPTHSTDYFYYSKLFDFSVSRNIMNTRTIKTAREEVLGTLYLDVSMDCLTNMIQEVNFGTGHEISIVDKKQGIFVYHEKDYNVGRDVEDLKPWLSKMTPEQPYLRAGKDYLIYNQVPGSDWVVVDRVAASKLESSYRSIRSSTLLILGIGALLLGIIYLFYSKKTSQPIRMLREVMGQMKEGNLEARVQINSHDEVGVVAEGLNEMAENLQKHIQRVYVAEMYQKNAELEALKTQIQPHYLYNTLDVIRMTAVTNDDLLTAEMLGSLSAQLKYFIGTSRDQVFLSAELENIRNYFNLIRLRFDHRYSLEINIAERFLSIRVPQLILQPVIENAVNHGLRPKQGEGMIGISAKQDGEDLEITVMDNGIGMKEEELQRLKSLLSGSLPGKRTEAAWESIGIKNVYDRIKLIYGEAYGLEITSYEGIGTMVKYKLPMNADMTGGE